MNTLNFKTYESNYKIFRRVSKDLSERDTLVGKLNETYAYGVGFLLIK